MQSREQAANIGLIRKTEGLLLGLFFYLKEFIFDFILAKF